MEVWLEFRVEVFGAVWVEVWSGVWAGVWGGLERSRAPRDQRSGRTLLRASRVRVGDLILRDRTRGPRNPCGVDGSGAGPGGATETTLV